MQNFKGLAPLDKKGLVKAIIESPKGSRNKYDFDKESGLFECGAALQGGMTFPFDFGFVPATRVEDGDPLDILVFMDEPAFAGCMVHTRIIGVMEAEQTEDGKTIRNDRLVGVHSRSVYFGELKHWRELPKQLRKEIEEFFVFYNRGKGRVFNPLGWRGPKKAYGLLEQSLCADWAKASA